MTHPHVLHAEAALWSLWRAARLLEAETRAAAYQPAARPVGRRRVRTLAEIRAEGSLLRAELHDRAESARWGLHPDGATPSPVPAYLLDLRAELDTTLTAAYQLLWHVHRHHRLLHWSAEWTDLAGTRLWMLAAVQGAPPSIAAQISADLDLTDRRTRSAIGAAPDWWRPPLAPTCPACDQRTLRVQTSAPDSRRWTIICVGCVCTGDDQCGMDVPARGVRHIWPAGSPLATSALAGATLLSREAA